MTFGGKIKSARNRCGFSQEQLAKKLCVSRSAIAKWETGKGMPDISNLKLLSQLLQVSLDFLLDEQADVETRYPYSLSELGSGCKRVKKDKLIRQQFPDATVIPLMARPEKPEEDPTVDSQRGILTPAPFGTPEFLKSIKDLDKAFYLVEQETTQLFVTVTDTFWEAHTLHPCHTEKSFRLGGWCFIRCDHVLAD